MKYADKVSKGDGGAQMNIRLVTYNLYPDLYKFLFDLGAIPYGQREETRKQTNYDPSDTSLFTAYKSLLHNVILCNYIKPPLQGWGLGMTESTMIRNIYEAHKIALPSDGQVNEIVNELQRIAKGYVEMVKAKAVGQDVGI